VTKAPDWPSETVQACTLPRAKVFVAPELPDWCEPLEDPTWLKPPQAALMRDDDTVLGFEAAGQTWAIPWWVMKNHHVANLTLAGKPFLVTLCERCAAGGIFDPLVGGRRFRFRITGWYRGSPLMVDDATGSLWALINAQPLQGPALEIGPLPKRPIVHATWQEWRTMYPETYVVHGEGEPRDGHGSEYFSPDHEDGMPHAIDRGLTLLDLVAGVELGASARAYSLTAVHARGGIVEDIVSGRPIVVASLPGSWLVVAFERELAGGLVELHWDRSQDPPTHFVDAVSGSRFDLWGVCVAGEHEGGALPYVPSTLKKWGVWTATYPDTEVWGLEMRDGAARG
jgi:hypothetical protein